MNAKTDVLVIGGGVAGLSAAVSLARARRGVTVVDAGEPRNVTSDAVHGLLGLEGINPKELLARGRADVSSYGGELISDRVVAVHRVAGGFLVGLAEGPEIRARILVIATGVVDTLPNVPGLAARWGRDVVHCPNCHGWEIRDRRVGVLASGPESVMQALLFRTLTSNLHLFAGSVDLSEGEMGALEQRGIPVARSAVAALQIVEDRMVGVRLDDGSDVALDALVVSPRSRPRLDGLDGLGLTATDASPPRVFVGDGSGRTPAADVWAVGNVVNPALQVSEAAGHGTRVAMLINAELVLGEGETLSHSRQPLSDTP